MFRKMGPWVIIIIYNIAILSGCSSYSVNLVKNNDGAKTVQAYTFGCKDYLPDIYIDEQDLSVWQYCPYGKDGRGELWKVGPTDNKMNTFIDKLPDKFKPMTKVKMQNCGDVVYKNNFAVLYCGECIDAGYKFKQWKDSKGRYLGLSSPYNHLEYTTLPLSPEMMQKKVEAYAEKYKLRESLLTEKGKLARKKQFKLTFEPDLVGTSFTDKDIAEFFDNAKSSGLDLGYRVYLVDQDSNTISFIKDRVNIIAEVYVDITQSKQLAYVYITVFGDSQTAVDAAMYELKKLYASKFH